MPSSRGARMLRPSSEEGAQMKANVGGFDKWARIVVGVLLIGWVLTGGPVWAWVGVVPLVTGLFNFCPLYRLLGVNTCKR
jgi:hypothetical protein